MAGAPLRNISEGEFNVGLFVVDGDVLNSKQASFTRGTMPWRAMMIQNHDAANFRFATVDWAIPLVSGAVMEVDRSDGRAKPVVDAAPHVRGFQIVLEAGTARLYIFDRALVHM